MSTSPQVAAKPDFTVAKLNDLLEFELAGVALYLHFSFMIFGPNRIPITKWFRDQAAEGLDHATELGEWVTALGGHPTIRVEEPAEGSKHDVRTILGEALQFERKGLAMYHELLNLVKDRDIALDEWTRGQIEKEQQHVYEIEKMLRGI